MAEHLTHIGVYEDVVRLIMHSDDFGERAKECFTVAYDSGLLGSGSRGNHLYAVPIITEIKTAFGNGETPENWQVRLAYALGWLMHRATDHLSKPLYRGVDAENDPRYNGNEYRIYHDAVVFREVYQGGRVSTESPYELLSAGTLSHNLKGLSASEAYNTPAVEELLCAYWQSELVNLYNFSKGEPGTDKWFEDLAEQFPVYQEVLSDYVQAYQNPAPDKMEKYITGPNFYDADDEIIQVVRTIQAGGDPGDIDVAKLVREADKGCKYAVAIKMTYEYAKGGNDYLEGLISKNKCYDIVHMEEQRRY